MPVIDASRGLDDLALAVYLERLLRGRRVLWIGDAQSGAPDRAARVASMVYAVDPQAIADHVERGNLAVVRAAGGTFVPPGAVFDVVVVPDLAAVGIDEQRLRDGAGGALAALAPGGVFVAGARAHADVRFGASATAGAIDYRAFHAAVAARFPHVRMLGQAPFVGIAVADFAAPPDPPVVLDGTLLGDRTEQPERFVALCAAGEVALDPYEIVQLPAASALREAGVVVRTAPSSTFESDTERQLGVLRDELRAARERAEHLSRELDDERLRGRQRRAESERAAQPTPPPFDPRVGELEAELRRAREELAVAHEHAEELEATLSQRTAALAELDGEVERARMALAAAKDESETRVSALRTAREELEKLRAQPLATAEEYGRLEETLRERAAEILALRAELDRRATLVRDLAEELRSQREGQALEEGTPLADAEQRAADASARLREAAARVASLEAEVARLRGERDAAVARAVSAEARAESSRLDAEALRGRVAELDARTERESDERTRREAELSGFVRGLRARAAELEELRAQAEARAQILRLDAESAARRILELERALVETREQFELELVRSSAGTAAARTSTAQAHVAQAGGATTKADEDASVAELARQLDEARAERDGLRLRLADREAALAALEAAREAAAATTAAGSAPAPELAGAPVDAAPSDAASGPAASPSVSTAAADAAVPAMADLDEARAALDEARAALSARDARIAELEQRLADAQAGLAEERVRAAERGTRLLQREEAIRSLEADAEERERDLGAARTRAEALDKEVRRLAAAVEEARAGLLALGAQIERVTGERRLPTLVGASLEDLAREDGDGLDPQIALLRERVDVLVREAADRDVLLRSLTAQLEERDERLRAAERRAALAQPGDAGAERALAELEERVARAADELAREREARRVAEAAAAAAARGGGDLELRRLQDLLGSRDAEVLSLQSRLRSGERDGRAMRDAILQARAAIEELLTEATRAGDAAASDRLGHVLRTLGRF
jgi:chromosome segregation ATPase